MIILEGTDLTGKTTLAQKLLARPELQNEGYVYRHLTRLPDGFDRYWGYHENSSIHTVQDRFHMSEVAYCYARSDPICQISPVQYRLIDAMLRGKCAYTVVLTADEELLEGRFAKRGRDEMYPLRTIHRANKAFEMLAKGVFYYDIDTMYRHVDCDMLLTFTQEEQWPTDDQVDEIAKRYARRMDELSTIYSSGNGAT